ncbi:MAG: helix-turn-helix domain-containing protein, partial [Planctomycetota bacterium]
EYALLEYLAMRAGELVPRTDVWEHVYDFHSDASRPNPDPHAFISWVNQTPRLTASRPNPDPHAFTSWVNQTGRLGCCSKRRARSHKTRASRQEIKR